MINYAPLPGIGVPAGSHPCTLKSFDFVLKKSLIKPFCGFQQRGEMQTTAVTFRAMC